MHRSNAHLLLVNPWIYDFAAYDYWLQPLGLLSIAGLLRRNGFHLSFVDCLDRSNPEMHMRHQEKRLRGNQGYGHGQF
ncbi:MAG: radical SAM protein, partial [bacterium]